MGAPKPILGYASRTDAVVALRGQGHSTAVIAAQLGIEPSTVVALEHSAARRGQGGLHRREAELRTVAFPVHVLDALRPYAIEREISPNELARRIVETAVGEALVDAILDDRVGHDRG